MRRHGAIRSALIAYGIAAFVYFFPRPYTNADGEPVLVAATGALQMLLIGLALQIVSLAIRKIVTRYERKRPGGQVLYRERQRWRLDTTPDDGALVMHLRGRGLVILTGCGHAGLINTVRTAVAETGVRKVHALVGGFHLCHAPARRIRATIRDLRAYAPRWVIPSHCSGLEFEAALHEAFPRGFALDSVGTEYIWP